MELLTGIAIAGVLSSLLLAAVQVGRATARRMACANNLRNQALALTAFCSAQQQFPAGRQHHRGMEYSWCLESLPYLDQAGLYSRFDRNRPWNHSAGNLAIAETSLRVFRCPSGRLRFDGETDYGGVLGSLVPGVWIPGTEMSNGVLVEVGAWRLAPVRPAEITDGVSQTMLIAECSDRAPNRGGRWISGFNCLSHDSGQINAEPGSDIFSLHAGGSNVAFADGHVQFVSSHTPPFIVGALCTRGGGESVAPH